MVVGCGRRLWWEVHPARRPLCESAAPWKVRRERASAGGRGDSAVCSVVVAAAAACVARREKAHWGEEGGEERGASSRGCEGNGGCPVEGLQTDAYFLGECERAEQRESHIVASLSWVPTPLPVFA